MPLKLSVITCTYNSEKYLGSLLESIETQLNYNFEHIFVDANSTDSTDNLIKEYSEKNASRYPIKIFKQIPSGISAAMNLGLKKAEGEFVWFLHSDDQLHNENSIAEVLLELNNSKVEWLVGNCYVIDRHGGIIDQFVKASEHFKNLKLYNCIPHSSTIVSANLLRKVGAFNENLKYAMDYDLWLRLSYLSQPTFTDNYLAKFRAHDLSLSTSNPVPVHVEDLKVRLSHSRKVGEKIFSYTRFLILLVFIKFPILKKLYLSLKSSVNKIN